mmetsp:Transcript_17687/g.66797  ORF Transcript_17687/g.66797 Transcript_17687/m.66797 type:complete len:341 (+) Transcript_17687:391-1413(+)
MPQRRRPAVAKVGGNPRRLLLLNRTQVGWTGLRLRSRRRATQGPEPIARQPWATQRLATESAVERAAQSQRLRCQAQQRRGRAWPGSKVPSRRWQAASGRRALPHTPTPLARWPVRLLLARPAMRLRRNGHRPSQALGCPSSCKHTATKKASSRPASFPQAGRSPPRLQPSKRSTRRAKMRPAAPHHVPWPLSRFQVPSPRQWSPPTTCLAAHSKADQTARHSGWQAAWCSGAQIQASSLGQGAVQQTRAHLQLRLGVAQNPELECSNRPRGCLHSERRQSQRLRDPAAGRTAMQARCPAQRRQPQLQPWQWTPDPRCPRRTLRIPRTPRRRRKTQPLHH